MVTGSGAVGLPPVISVIIVTSVGPALSDTESGSIRTTRCAAEVSSSSSVTAAAVTARDPESPSTARTSSGSISVSFTGPSVNVDEASVPPAGMVTVNDAGDAV